MIWNAALNPVPKLYFMNSITTGISYMHSISVGYHFNYRQTQAN